MTGPKTKRQSEPLRLHEPVPSPRRAARNPRAAHHGTSHRRIGLAPLLGWIPTLTLILGGGCAKPMRVALGARDFMARRGRCEVVSGKAVRARRHGQVDAVAKGKAKLRCKKGDRHRRYTVEVVDPDRLVIEGPARLEAWDKGTYRLRAYDDDGNPIEVGRVDWEYPGNLKRAEGCGHMIPLPCPQWIRATRVKPVAGREATLTASLGSHRASLTITVDTERRAAERSVALGARLPLTRYGTCRKLSGDALVRQGQGQGKGFLASKEGEARLDCVKAGGAARIALTVTVKKPARITVTGTRRPVVGSVDAHYQLRAVVPDPRMPRGERVLHVGTLRWKHSHHFGPPRRKCVFDNRLCVQSVRAGSGWVGVEFAGQAYRMEVQVRKSYRE